MSSSSASVGDSTPACASATHSSTSVAESTPIKPPVTVSVLWNHVRVIQKSQKGKGGNLKFHCKICDNEYSGSLYRIKAHLLKIPGRGVAVCPKIEKPMVEKLAAEVAQDEARILSSTTQRGKSTQVASTNIGGTAGSGSFRVQGVDPFDQRKRKADIKSPLEK
ncbi:hypothetical protein M5689_018366 [Euphorbia peplus]|nr:hypothetical protein M5689_018366 [Euphorbia peplus]